MLSFDDQLAQFQGNSGGRPLGRAYPVREDYSHAVVVRADPCSYCPGVGGTLDHIDPRRYPGAKRGTWLNWTGACESCNGHKADEPLLGWLLMRAG